MRDREHYIKVLAENPNATIGTTLAAAAVYAARHGRCEPEDRGDDWRAIVRDLQARYGENLTVDEVRREMRGLTKEWP